MFNVAHIIQSGGLLLIALIVFAESGLLVGFFLPGDTLLFTAGFFAGQGKLPLAALILVIIVAAIVGDNIGYEIGKRTGHRIFKKADGLFFRREYVTQAEKFYEKHGGKTVLFARFIPVIRTFAPLVAGIGHMPRKRFVIYDLFGAALWGTGITLLGVWLGSKIPNIDHYLLPIIVLAMLFSFSPTIYHLVRDPKIRKRVAQMLKRQRSS